MDWVATRGPTCAYMMATGDQTVCMERVCSRGRMVESILEITSTTRKMDKVSSFGLMDGAIMASGKMVDSTAEALIYLATGNLGVESGVMDAGLDGLVGMNDQDCLK